MNDVIRLIGLGGVGRHGVLPEERRAGQLFKVDVIMAVDTRAAAEGDDLDLTVNYAEVAADVVGLVEGEPVNLVETLAARIADAVLARAAVQSVEVTVHKPEAPVGVPFDDVQVTIVRDRSTADLAPAAQEPVVAAAPAMAPAAPAAVAAVHEPEPQPEGRPTDLDAEPDEPVEVVLGLGGNVGDVRATLRQAIDDLAATSILEVVDVAPLAKTAAVLQPDAVSQPDFLNTVVVVRTSASPRAVLAVAHEIENAHGRVREQRWGERTLDIDIITYGSVSSPDPELSLPHPRANERAFVLVPWSHMDPDAFLPGLGGGPVAVLADTAPDRDGVRWLALDWYEQRGARPEPAPVPAPAPAEAEPEAEDLSTSRVDTGNAGGTPVALAEPEQASIPEPAPWVPQPVPEPTPQPEPLPTPEPEPEPIPEPGPQPEPIPEPGPLPQPEPIPEPEPGPLPQPEPAPAPAPEPVVPTPEPTPAPMPQPEPEPVREQEPDPARLAPPVLPTPPAQPAPDPVHRPAGEPRPLNPWEQPVEPESPQRIRPRWEPIRREDTEE